MSFRLKSVMGIAVAVALSAGFFGCVMGEGGSGADEIAAADHTETVGLVTQCPAASSAPTSATILAQKKANPIPTIAPDFQRLVDFYMDGLAVRKERAGDFLDALGKKKYGLKHDSDPIYLIVGLEQEYDENGNPKYTDITVPKKINGIPVVFCQSFAGHYEIKRLRIQCSINSLGLGVDGCTSLESYDMAPGTEIIGDGQFEGCRSLTSVSFPKGMKEIRKGTFKDCPKLKNITFEKFSDFNDIEGLQSATAWWNKNIEKYRQKDGKLVYQGSLVDIGKTGDKVTIHGGKIKKILYGALKKSKATSVTIDGVKEIGGRLGGKKVKTIRVSNVKKLHDGALHSSSVEKIVLGEGISVIPESCFGIDRSGSRLKLKEIWITSKKRIKWGVSDSGAYCGVGLWEENLPKNHKLDIYITGKKIHQESLHSAYLSSTITLHVPKKMVQKYRDCVNCKVVAL